MQPTQKAARLICGVQNLSGGKTKDMDEQEKRIASIFDMDEVPE
jgi:hypothetical protein